MAKPMSRTASPDNPRVNKINALLDKRQPSLTVLMEQVHKPHNLAAVVRTCDAVGVGKVHAVYAPGAKKACGHTASGSQNWVDVVDHKDLATAIHRVKAKGMQVVAAHLSDTAVSYREVDYTKPTCVLIGSELEGVSAQAAAAVDQHIIIPMVGMVQSLNVSVATAVVLYEAYQQRLAAGMYDARQLADQTCERLLVEWLHPQVIKFCRKHRLRYPVLNEHGDIDDPEWQQLRLATQAVRS